MTAVYLKKKIIHQVIIIQKNKHNLMKIGRIIDPGYAIFRLHDGRIIDPGYATFRLHDGRIIDPGYATFRLHEVNVKVVLQPPEFHSHV
jgi:hypothetical protein